MTNFTPPWQQYRMYCTRCRKWKHDIRHTDCATGQMGSLIMIDLVNHRKGCTKCQQTWPIENVVFYCGCGHAQPVEYVTSIGPLEHGDKVMKTEGTLTWVRTKSHFIRVGQT
jgi:hypothetical protein